MLSQAFDSAPDWLRRRDLGADDAIVAGDRTSRRTSPVVQPERTPAVYFVSAGGMVKVGRVARIEKLQARLQIVQTGCPEPIKVRLVVDGWGQREESAIHKLFADCHHRGEWFREDGRMAEFLRAVAEDHDVAVAWLGISICR